MKKITNHIVLNDSKISPWRSTLNHLMLVVLSSLIFQVFFSVNMSSADSFLASGHQAFTVDQHLKGASSLIDALLPPKASHYLLDVELTTDDEVRRSPVSDSCIPSSYFTSHYEGFYYSYLKRKFIHLTSQVNNRPPIAFYILYHSWKSDLT